jgi:D-3-phosphoglycerate dehydrogenase
MKTASIDVDEAMERKKYRILIADSSIRPEGLHVLEPYASLALTEAHAPERELVREAKDVDAILVRSATISKPVIDASQKLVVVSRHGVGVDNVDVEECSRQGILVTTTGDANSEAVSELAFACIMACSRKLTVASAEFKAGKWDRSALLGMELRGKTLGIIGFGRIGSRVAQHSRGFEMEVLVHDTNVDAESARAMNCTQVDLPTLLRRSDFITLHIPLVPETKNIIGKAEFELMKPTAILVNTARGGLVDEHELYNALVQKRIAAAALDVFDQEPMPADHPLRRLDNLIGLPHMGGQTVEAMVRMSKRAAENILLVLRGEIPDGVVNPEVLRNPAIRRCAAR